ncbi:MAG: PilN domain-containing protein [Acidobacteriota bacterium]
MIRINLLSEGRRPAVARKTGSKLAIGDTDPSVLFLAGGLVLGLLIGGILYFLAQSALKEKQAAVGRAQQRVAELEPILKEVDEYKAKKEELSTKIDVITQLTTAQKGPVNLMDRVSRALPEQLWLNSMTVKGSKVQLDGIAFNTTAIASFIENLASVPEFKEPDTKDVSRNGGAGTTTSYSFKIEFDFEYVAEEPETAVAAETAETAVADAA